MQTQALDIRFRAFLTKLMERNGIREAPTSGATHDLSFESKIARAVVETKVYRSSYTPTETIIAAAAFAEERRIETGSSVAILATPSIIPQWLRAKLRQNPKLVLYDHYILATLAQDQSDLASEFKSIVADAITLGDETVAWDEISEEDTEASFADDVAKSAAAIELKNPPVSVTKQGSQLCKDLKAVPPGNAGAAEFERRCTDALKYLFSNDLSSWLEQNPTDENFHRHDLVARVNSKHDFWTSLRDSFRSRYIIFEFKNYTDLITQSEIYSTEKYLFPTALRSTAIVISRVGADENALRAGRGALREAGKIILTLNIEDICRMLDQRDEGSDHNARLVELLDDILIKVNR